MSRTTTIMPLSHQAAGAHDGGMTTHPWSQIVVRDRSDQGRGPTDLPADLTIEQFFRRNDGGFRRPLAALFGSTLHRQLAAGRPPESGALLAARAARLVSVPTRRRLAQGWERVLDQALSAPRQRNPHAPLCRKRISDAMGDVHAMLGALSTPLPVSARGVAMASRLLSDGTGPLYNRSCTVRLSTALAEVTAELDPAFTPSRAV
jgi:hypothetical protein